MTSFFFFFFFFAASYSSYMMDPNSTVQNWKWCTGCSHLRGSNEFSKLVSGCERKICDRHLNDSEKKARPAKFDDYSTLLSDVRSWSEEVTEF